MILCITTNVDIETHSMNIDANYSKSFNDDGRLKRTGTYWTTSSHIITAVIGSGVLSLAWVVGLLGWIAGPTMIDDPLCFGHSPHFQFASALLQHHCFCFGVRLTYYKLEERRFCSYMNIQVCVMNERLKKGMILCITTNVDIETHSMNIDANYSKSFNDDGRLKRTGTYWTTSSHIITAVIGSGVLSLAWVVGLLGWIAGPTMIDDPLCFGHSPHFQFASALLQHQ
ncbi:amino acid transporter, transmembrane domain-containing protein [Artemisia annua]|uniref:Amino acid transporter, transmembrane domain-containing protein n=1 Tax=Artemisia annua TaxID=35608 RepID=A0A2U1MN43_ARTAN|nr:amino acid transporter, transmembrane domain-containing protein [Artemisia annua]